MARIRGTAILVSCTKSNMSLGSAYTILNRHFSNERFLICHSSTGNKFFIFVFFIMQRGVLL